MFKQKYAKCAQLFDIKIAEIIERMTAFLHTIEIVAGESQLCKCFKSFAQ